MAEQSKGDLPGKNRSIKLLIENCFLAPESGQIRNEGKNFFDNCSFKKLRSGKNQGRCDEEEELQEKYFFVRHQKIVGTTLLGQILDLSNGKKIKQI